MENTYITCPYYETENFILRLIRVEDADDLLRCYQDPLAQPLFNADKCNTDFCFETLDELRDYVAGWVTAYEKEEFIRFAIPDKSISKAVGTIEIFGKMGAYRSPVGILRLDIRSEYESEKYLYEILRLCAEEFFTLFDVDTLIHKAVPVATERIKALKALGFVLGEFSGRPHYWILKKIINV